VLERVTTFDIGDPMTITPSELIILALNSGSSSLKFGLYCVSALRTETLLSGIAESIGEATSKFHVLDGQGNTLVTDAAPILRQREAVSRISDFLDGSQMPAPAAAALPDR
jgi:acetate kinase